MYIRLFTLLLFAILFIHFLSLCVLFACFTFVCTICLFTLQIEGVCFPQGSIRENLDPLGMHSDRHMMSLLKDVGLWDVLAGLSLSRSKAAGQPIPAAITSYASSVASSVPTGDALTALCTTACTSPGSVVQAPDCAVLNESCALDSQWCCGPWPLYPQVMKPASLCDGQFLWLSVLCCGLWLHSRGVQAPMSRKAALNASKTCVGCHIRRSCACTENIK